MNEIFKSGFWQFCEMLRDGVKRRMGESYEVSLQTVTKNNDVKLEGLVIRREGCLVTPTIYLNTYYDAYQQGSTIGRICEEVIDTYKINQLEQPEDIALDPEEIRKNIFYRLVSLEKNQEQLAEMPYLTAGEYAITFQCLVYEKGLRIGTIRITKEHCLYWNLTKQELIRLANENTARISPPTLKPMEEVLETILQEELLGCRTEEDAERYEELEEALEEQKRRNQVSMYVLSNAAAHHGATSLLYREYLDAFLEKLGDDVYVLPSSIHEVILVPKKQAPDYAVLENMVKEINQTQVPEQEVLSDHVYAYSEFRAQLPEALAIVSAAGF